MTVMLLAAFGAILGGAAGPVVVQLTAGRRPKQRSWDQRQVEHRRRLAVAHRAANSADPTVRAIGLALLGALTDQPDSRRPNFDLGP